MLISPIGTENRHFGTVKFSGRGFGDRHQMEVFKERKEGVERETTRHNNANMMAENACEDKGHDIRTSVTEETSSRIDCMQRRS